MAESKKIGDENELMLELSIGGIFGKRNRDDRDDRNEDLNDVGQSKGEIQSLRRRELRRKREEKLKKSGDLGSCGSVNGPFVENKDWLESEILRRKKEGLEIEPARKKEKIGDVPEKGGVISTAPVDDGGGEDMVRISDDTNVVFRPTPCRSFRKYEGNLNRNPNEMKLNGGGSSAFSDGQCSSHHGGATDDSRSNSSNSQPDHQPASTSTASVGPFDPSDQPTDSSKQTISTAKLTDSTLSEPSPIKPNDQPNPHDSKPVTTSQNQQASLLARMPCVSTTGNGPNGKTVSGFLYRYTKNEVSIVCVCHGRSFSPAGFVEHAGGVDIVHPLKHITIFPAAFAS